VPHQSDPLTFLFGLERLGMTFGLETMTRLCAALGHPERRFRSVLIAGTNGKGSVTAMVETALRAAGHRSARYTSPHLERLEERFVIDGREVTREALTAAVARVRDAVLELERTGRADATPTFFECATATAFELFADAGVDIAVLEVGLGGRLDATNVVAPIAAAITSIDFDHQALLGNTLEEIAREKAGVIKSSIPVVCGRLPAAALRVIEQVCDRQGARLIRADREVSIACRAMGDRSDADFTTAAHALTGVALALRGRHQAANASVAVRLLEELGDLGIAVDARAIRAGLEQTAWPGRLERIDYRGTEILLDAAHNPGGAQALAAYLSEAGWTDATLVFGALRDKDVSGMLAPLSPLFDRIVCTTPVSPRALPAAETAEIAARHDPGRAAEIVPDPAAALERARALSKRVVVAGSIFLIGPLRGILR
jgi:dihydrofolate synthase/folylpolyglutamate synthase